MVACTACRAAKVKCESSTFPCRRCTRRDLSCIPHVSRQGRRRAVGNTGSSAERTNIHINHNKRRRDEDTTTTTREDDVIADGLLQQPAADHLRHHYGLRHLIRQWICLAVKRRTWALWARAGHLADACGMSMDDILCHQTTPLPQRGMDCLYPFLLTPAAEQTVVGPPLQVSEVPMSLWRAIGIGDDNRNDKDATIPEDVILQAMADRWVFLRETNRGVSRFYVSPAFAAHVVTRAVIEDTYRANAMDIAALYLTPACGNTTDFVRGFTQQIGLHVAPGMVTPPTHLPHVRIRTKTQSSTDTNINQQPQHGEQDDDEYIIQEVDQLWCLAIPDMDQSFGLTEFIPKHNHNRGPQSSKNFSDTEERDFLDSLLLESLDLNSQDDDLALIHDLFLRATTEDG